MRPPAGGGRAIGHDVDDQTVGVRGLRSVIRHRANSGHFSQFVRSIDTSNPGLVPRGRTHPGPDARKMLGERSHLALPEFTPGRFLDQE